MEKKLTEMLKSKASGRYESGLLFRPVDWLRILILHSNLQKNRIPFPGSLTFRYITGLHAFYSRKVAKHELIGILLLKYV
ncbi:hypothetical protein, partial [Fulvivirga kasyanovii]|uniref:hypothetical protein n=1 Tax=Fulvivirga kasyanovii TaxID=396812 RepID=UPI001C8823C9